jgi:hypothetical protein
MQKRPAHPVVVVVACKGAVAAMTSAAGVGRRNSPHLVPALRKRQAVAIVVGRPEAPFVDTRGTTGHRLVVVVEKRKAGPPRCTRLAVRVDTKWKEVEPRPHMLEQGQGRHLHKWKPGVERQYHMLGQGQGRRPRKLKQEADRHSHMLGQEQGRHPRKLKQEVGRQSDMWMVEDLRREDR